MLSVLWFFFYFFFSSPEMTARAADEDIEEVLIQSSRIRIPLPQGKFGAETLEEKQSTSLVETLRQIPGLDVQQNGGPGGMASISIRGAKTEHTLVLVDDVPVNDPIEPGRSFNFNDLPIESIESVEILSGPQTAKYGSDALAGVILIRTKRGSLRTKATASTEMGTYSTFLQKGSISGAITPQIRYRASASRLDREGFSAAKDEQTPNPDVDGFASTHAGLRTDFRPLPAVQLGLGGDWNQSQADLDLFGGPGGDDPNYQMETERYQLRADGRVNWKSARTRFVGSFSDQVRISENPRDPIQPFSEEQNRFQSKRFFVEMHHRQDWSDVVSNDFGLHSQTDYGRFDDRGILQLEQEAQTLGGTAGVEIRPVPTWKLGLDGRFEKTDSFSQQTAFGLNSTLTVPSTRTEFLASAGTGFKTPSLFQRFSQWGNATLAPESSLGGELGIRENWIPNRLLTSFSVFRNRFQNMIEFQPGVPGQYFNQSDAAIQGFHASIESTLPGAVDLDFTYRNTNGYLLRKPQHRFQVAASKEFRRPRIRITADLQYVGSREDVNFISFEAVPLEAYRLLSLRARWSITPHFQLFGRVENLLNESYAEVLGYQTAGFSTFSGLRLIL